jgi:hypothetical protein
MYLNIKLISEEIIILNLAKKILYPIVEEQWQMCSSFSFELEDVIYFTKEMTEIRNQPVLEKKKEKRKKNI